MKILLDAAPINAATGAPPIDEQRIRTEEGARVRAATLVERNARSKELSTIGDKLIADHGRKNGGRLGEHIRKMVSDAIISDESIASFQVRCMESVIGATPAIPTGLEDVTEDPQSYSLMRGIRSAYENKLKGAAAIPDGQEGETHKEIMRRAKENGVGGLGFQPAGFQVPNGARVSDTGLTRSEYRERMKRDMQATVFGSGGAVVPTILMPPIIELLRNMMALSNVGMRVMGGLSGNIVIPRQEAAATAYSVAEISALTASQQVLGQIALSPKRVGATENYSKQLIFQSSPDIQDFILADLFKVLALKWDYLGINGQGAASEPLGVLNTPGIGSVTFGATPTYIKLIAFRTAIESLNVTDPLNWLTTPTVKGTLSGVAEALTGATTIGGSANAIWKPEGRMVGIPALATNQMPNNLVLLGAFTHLIQAMWGGLDVVVDNYTLAPNAEVKLTINTWGDFAVRHPQAFCVSADAGNQ